jgi:hypothetical protein
MDRQPSNHVGKKAKMSLASKSCFGTTSATKSMSGRCCDAFQLAKSKSDRCCDASQCTIVSLESEPIDVDMVSR